MMRLALAAATHTTWQVHLAADEAAGRRLEGRQLEEQAFVDVKEVPFTELFYPHGMMDASTGHVLTMLPPWSVDANPDARVYRSRFLSRGFNSLFNREAPGLNATYSEVFMALERGLCIPYVIGGEVRDLLWRKEGLDVDISFSCSVQQVAAIAKREGWPVFTKPGKAGRAGYMHLGTEGAQDPIEGKEAKVLAAPAAEQEFVCNSLVYDVGVNQAVIDRFGQGLVDDRDKIIRIPGPEGLWPDWVAAAPNKLVRYFKLRALPKGFTGEPRTSAFVLGEIKQRMQDAPQETQALFGSQLKHFLLGLNAQEATEKLGHLRDAMVADLGQAWYDEHVKPVEPRVGPDSPVLI